MKLYSVYPEKFNIGDTLEVIVLAHSEYDALKICGTRFDEWQGKIYAKEVDLSVEQIILTRYFHG